METISSKHPILPVPSSFPMRWYLTSSSMQRFQQVSLQKVRAGVHKGGTLLTCWAKKFELQDFQSFARPLRLLPATQVNISSEASLDRVDESCSLYVLQLQTSRDFGSSLSDPNAALLICLIDIKGDSILQRIPATTFEHDAYPEQMDIWGTPRFQRGHVDKISFKGPKLGNVEAFWIGVESGSWRIGGVSLTVINPQQSTLGSTGDGKQHRYHGLQYNFEAVNIMLGEGGDASMAELRPTLVTELEVEVSTLLDMGLSQSIPSSNQKVSPEESMREYADLKLSLLLYDAMLVIAGTLIAASTNEKAAQGFLVGGISGFLYLLLLQKSVDGLSVPALSSVAEVLNEKREDHKQIFGRVKGPITSVALVFALTVVILKYSMGNALAVLTPQELLAGAVGFLMCKVAVVLAAIKPMQTSFKESK